MSILCPCGFDCGDFITQHQISADARFSCPACDSALRALDLPSLVLTQEPDVLSDAGLVGGCLEAPGSYEASAD